MFEYYKEMEDRKTLDAKFAKAVDSISPLLYEMTLPEQVILGRFKFFNFGIAEIVAKKKIHFVWDKVLVEMFAYLIEKLIAIKNTQEHLS